MSRQSRRDTTPELVVRSAVWRRGLRYYVDRRPLRTVRRRADLVFPSQRVAVFIDGCFWHGCPMHGRIPKTNTAWWDEKIRRNRARDSSTTDLLRAAGWTVLRFWEHEDPEVVASDVERAVRSPKRLG